MPVAVQPGHTDLYLPLPTEDDPLDPYVVHTHYFGISVPEARVGAYIYLRCMPHYGMSQGGLTVFQGFGEGRLLDAAYHDYRASMPWPQLDGNRIVVANGLTIDVLEPGERIRLTYESRDGATALDVEQHAITPLLARGHIIPGEDDHHDGPGRAPGGIEQFMHATGTLTLEGERHAVDCLAVRDRSWLQVRGEDPGGVRPHPPLGWTPIAFGPDLALNVTSFEAPDTDPAWAGLYEVPEGAPTHHSGWVVRDGESREITRVRRNVLEYHPAMYAAVRQELEVTDEAGETLRFSGEAIAMSAMHSWPNIAFCDSVYRWTAEDGRQTHCTYQEIWYAPYQQRMRHRFARR